MSVFLNFNFPDFSFNLNSIIFTVFFVLIIVILALNFIVNLYKILFKKKKHKEDPMLKKILEKYPGISHKKAHAILEAMREQALD